MSEEIIETLIVGAGPVGLCLASELNRRKRSVKIIEVRSEIEKGHRAVHINNRTLDLMDKLGIGKEVIEKGFKNDCFQVLESEGSSSIYIDHQKQTFHKNKFQLTLPQPQFEEILIEHLSRNGVQVQRDTNFQMFEVLDSPNGTIVESKIIQNGVEQTLKSKYLVSCQGAQSSIRKQAGINFGSQNSKIKIWIVDVDFSEVPSFVHGYATMPCNGIGFIQFGEKTFRTYGLKENLENQYPKGLIQKKVIWKSFSWLNTNLAETYQQGPIFLAGDAAHIHGPYLGKGMNLGIEDAFVLAALIANKRTDEYTEIRKPAGAYTINTTKIFMVLYHNNNISKVIRYILKILINNLKSVQNYFVKEIYGLNQPLHPLVQEQ